MTDTRFAAVPDFVLARFPGLDPTRPETTPEPEKCVKGRPWGEEPHGALYVDTAREFYARRWENYLAWLDAGADPKKWGAPCRNRATREPEHMCGQHSNTYRTQRDQQDRARARQERLERNLDLAKQITALGVTADGWSDNIRLQPEAAEKLIDRLTADAHALTDLLGAVERMRDAVDSASEYPAVMAAAARTRRHLDRVNHRTTDPEGA